MSYEHDDELEEYEEYSTYEEFRDDMEELMFPNGPDED